MDSGGGEDGRKDFDEKFRKNHEITFEACKHFTTLDTAAVLIVAVLSRETGLGLSVVLWPLIFFGASLFSCAYGMLVTVLGGLGSRRAAISTGRALILGAVLFLAALGQMVLAGLGYAVLF